MPRTIEVESRVVGVPKCADGIDSVLVEIADDEITVAELIRRTVAEQIHVLTSKRRMERAQVRRVLARQYLSLADIQKQAEQGRVRMPSGSSRESRPIDVGREVERALKAFRDRRVLVLVGGRQAESLDERLSFAEQTKATFLRLMPLAGGV